MKHYITIEPTIRSSKPTDIKELSLNLIHKFEVTINDFVTLMNLGITFTPALYKDNKRSNDNWLSQSIFALDFDSGIPADEVLQKFAEFNIIPNIIYNSFSHTEAHPKYRLVFFLDNEITCKKSRDVIQLALMQIAEYADESCKDAARMYFGGNNAKVLSNDPLVSEYIVDVSCCKTIASDGMRSRKIAAKGSLEKNWNLLDSSTRSEVFNQTEVVRKFDFKRLQNTLTIYHTFKQGVWLTHKEIFGLATAMHWVEGGIKDMKQTMLKWNAAGKTAYTDNNFASLIYVKKKKYQPQQLINYSPHKEDWEYTNPIEAVKDQLGYVEITKKDKPMTLEQMEDKFTNVFNQAIEHNDTNIHIIKVPTGAGKTKKLENIKSILAFPTHSLKDEVWDRMQVTKVKTPELPTLTDTILQEKIESLYKRGLNKHANRLINNIAKNKKNVYNKEDEQLMKEYKLKLRNVYSNTDDALLTTHSRATHSEFNHNTIIYDEDPLSTLLPIRKLNLADVLTIKNKCKEGQIIFDKLDSIPAGECIQTPQLNLNINSLVDSIYDSEILSDIVSLLDSDFILRDGIKTNIFTYIKKHELPKDKKIIILSATIPIFIYHKLYGDRVEASDLTNVEYNGSIIQHTAKSYSRASLKSHMHKINDIIDTNLPTITFKEYVPRIQNAVESMYFGNLTGYDKLKGKNINVVGTPHMNSGMYMLIANVMGTRLKATDMIYQTIEWEGRKFKFNCYDDELLRNIQLSLIESELLQAVGRNRGLREKVITNLYSNFPLLISESFSK